MLKKDFSYWLFAMVIVLFCAACDKQRIYEVQAIPFQLKALDQIEMLKDSLVTPYLYSDLTGFEQLSVEQSKNFFIAATLPSILVAKHRIETDRMRLERMKRSSTWSKTDSIRFLKLAGHYNAKSVTEILERMVVLPNSIVLAQAAVESGWGRSRFFKEANNVFGIWSVNKNEPRMAAGKTRSEKVIYVRAYGNISQSINDYFRLLSTAPAYESLRKINIQERDPYVIIKHLKNYSEKKSAYIQLLASVIEQNNLTVYDAYSINPRYLLIKEE